MQRPLYYFMPALFTNLCPEICNLQHKYLIYSMVENISFSNTYWCNGFNFLNPPIKKTPGLANFRKLEGLGTEFHWLGMSDGYIWLS